MFNHTTPPSGGSDHDEQAAEPPNSRRFADQRGIALQTIIILVVLLAIAGAVAAVILTRAGQETERLEQTDSAAYGITNKSGCQLGGHQWDATINTAPLYNGLADDVKAALGRAGVTANDVVATKNNGICKPK